MLTKKVTVGTTKENLKTLLETAGIVFPNSGNNKCTGVILQLDPAASNSVEILDENAVTGDGIVLINGESTQPTFAAFKVDSIDRVNLLASGASTDVKVLVEQD